MATVPSTTSQEMASGTAKTPNNESPNGRNGRRYSPIGKCQSGRNDKNDCCPHHCGWAGRAIKYISETSRHFARCCTVRFSRPASHNNGKERMPHLEFWLSSRRSSDCCFEETRRSACLAVAIALETGSLTISLSQAGWRKWLLERPSKTTILSECRRLRKAPRPLLRRAIKDCDIVVVPVHDIDEALVFWVNVTNRRLRHQLPC